MQPDVFQEEEQTRNRHMHIFKGSIGRMKDTHKEVNVRTCVCICADVPDIKYLLSKKHSIRKKWTYIYGLLTYLSTQH